MSATYIPQDVIDECREAHRQGVTINVLASKLDIEPDELARLMGLPQWRQVPAQNDGRLDLWAVEDVL